MTTGLRWEDFIRRYLVIQDPDTKLYAVSVNDRIVTEWMSDSQAANNRRWQIAEQDNGFIWVPVAA